MYKETPNVKSMEHHYSRARLLSCINHWCLSVSKLICKRPVEMFPAYATQGGGVASDKIMRLLRKELTVSVQIKCPTLLLPNEHFCFFNLIQTYCNNLVAQGRSKKGLVCYK